MRKFKFLMSLIIVLGLVSSASATNAWWYGTVDNDIYNVDNYDRPLLPGEPDSGMGINWSLSNMGLYTDGKTYRMFAVSSGTHVFSSMWTYCEWASTANPYNARIEVTGGASLSSAALTMGTIGYGDTTMLNDGSTVISVGGFTLGRTIAAVNPNWLTYTQTGDALTQIPSIWLGRNSPGRFELYGGDLEISSSAVTGIGPGSDQMTMDPSMSVLDIRNDGMIIWAGDHTFMGDDAVQNLVDGGVLTGYGIADTAHVLWSYNFMDDETIITGIPEPATIALLGLGGLVLLRKRS